MLAMELTNITPMGNFSAGCPAEEGEASGSQSMDTLTSTWY